MDQPWQSDFIYYFFYKHLKQRNSPIITLYFKTNRKSFTKQNKTKKTKQKLKKNY